MIRVLGGEDALNLDGGGSSTLWSGELPDKGIANTRVAVQSVRLPILFVCTNKLGK